MFWLVIAPKPQIGLSLPVVHEVQMMQCTFDGCDLSFYLTLLRHVWMTDGKTEHLRLHLLPLLHPHPTPTHKSTPAMPGGYWSLPNTKGSRAHSAHRGAAASTANYRDRDARDGFRLTGLWKRGIWGEQMFRMLFINLIWRRCGRKERAWFLIKMMWLLTRQGKETMVRVWWGAPPVTRSCGWCPVCHASLWHRYNVNLFCCGRCSSLPSGSDAFVQRFLWKGSLLCPPETMLPMFCTTVRAQQSACHFVDVCCAVAVPGMYSRGFKCFGQYWKSASSTLWFFADVKK